MIESTQLVLWASMLLNPTLPDPVYDDTLVASTEKELCEEIRAVVRENTKGLVRNDRPGRA